MLSSLSFFSLSALTLTTSVWTVLCSLLLLLFVWTIDIRQCNSYSMTGGYTIWISIFTLTLFENMQFIWFSVRFAIGHCNLYNNRKIVCSNNNKRRKSKQIHVWNIQINGKLNSVVAVFKVLNCYFGFSSFFYFSLNLFSKRTETNWNDTNLNIGMCAEMKRASTTCPTQLPN